MIRLIYSSVADPDLDIDDVKSILVKSQKKNKERNITGVLIYGPGMFLQIIEGEEIKIRTLMKDIIADKRHSEIEVLCEFPVDQRSFDDWSMGLIYIHDKKYNISDFSDFNEIKQNSNITKDTEGKFVQACLDILNCW